MERVQFERSGDGRDYNERWLQDLVQGNPELLPVIDIEPAYRPVIPVCTELPTSRGYLDNFFITPNGNLIFAEVKLWRNTESRRQVITQVMDYIESLTAWSYAELERAIGDAEGQDGFQSLYGLVEAESELDEASFIDAVSRNLQLGRGLFFIIGDGIREEAETLTHHVQAHAGMHFALALLELACYRLPDGSGQVVQPRTIARTVNIERGIVRIEGTGARIEAPKVLNAGSRSPSASPVPQTLSSEAYYEGLSELDAALPNRLEAFLEKIKPLRVKPEFKRSLILRWRAIDGTTFNIGYVSLQGELWTDQLCSRSRELGVLDITQEYIRKLADIMGGDVRDASSGDNLLLIKNGKAAKITDLLEHDDEWVECIASMSREIDERLGQEH